MVVARWKSAGVTTGAQFMKEVVEQAVAAGRKAVIWDDTMGRALEGNPNVVVQVRPCLHSLC